MTAAEAYAQLRAAGAEVFVIGRSRLFLRAPAEALQDGKLAALARDHRAELGRELRGVEVCGDCRAPATVLLAVVRFGGDEARVCSRCLNESAPEAVEVEIKARRSA